MPDKNNINENELDKLLKDLYLEENGKTADADLAQFVMSQEYDVTVNPEKEKEVLRKLQKGKPGFGGYKLYLSAIALVILSGLAFYFFKKSNKQIIQSGHKEEIINAKGSEKSNEKISDVKESVSIKVQRPRDTFGRMSHQVVAIRLDSAKAELKESVTETAPKAEPELPYVTEYDRVRYKKIKNVMMQKLYERDKELYAHIEADKTEYCAKSFTTDAYNMRTMGITNLEYKTFLADLLVQNRREEYVVAKVQSEKWNIYGCAELGNIYFQDEKYNDFPVVNMALEGAKLFCKWEEEEIKLYMKQNKLKFKALQIRLPYDYEWIYAARNGYVKVSLEPGYNTIYDLREGLVDESFVNRTGRIKKRVKRSDSLYYLIPINHYGWSEKELNDLFNKGFKYYTPAPADTIYTERMRIYGKVAHVSEIIIEKRSGQTWLIGGSWKNKEDYLKLQGEFKTSGASPFVGFRPVVINGNDPVYKNPFP